MPTNSKKPRSEKRHRSLQVLLRMTDAEHETLKRKADAEGMSCPSYVRARVAASNLKKIETVPPELYPTIIQIANEINHVARKANAGAPISSGELRAISDQIRSMMPALEDHKARRELQGRDRRHRNE
jgi:hypothetical protein